MGVHTAEYEEYIRSPEWEQRKVRYYSSHEKRCAACGSTERIHLHHHTYERLRHELDSDLIPLCSTCHRLVHRFHSRQRRLDLTEATFLFVHKSQLGDPPERRRAKRKPRASSVRPPKPNPAIKRVAIGVVAEAFGVPQKVLRQQGYQRAIPVDKVAEWRESRPDWMPVGAVLVGDELLSAIRNNRRKGHRQ